MIFLLSLVSPAETLPRNTRVQVLSGRHLLALVRLLPHRALQVPPRTFLLVIAVLQEHRIGQILPLLSHPWIPILRIGEISVLAMWYVFSDQVR
jgi:hypothetical protein